MKNLSRNTDNMGVEICKLETIMDQALILSKSKFVKKDISFTQVGYQNLKDTNLLCKEIEIGQIIINLLNNSVDAVSELSDRWIKIEYKKDESFMTLSFIDSGTGIDPKIKNRILEPFYSSKDIGKGTGLGLSISQKLIMNQRGSLELDVESEHTKFDLAIPLAK